MKGSNKMKHSNKTKKANSKINNSNEKEGTTEMKDILTRKFDTITMEEFMELKMITEHDTDYLLGEIDKKLKDFMKDILEHSQNVCEYHFSEFVVAILDDINIGLKVVSYEIHKGYEALDAIRKTADEDDADVAYYDMYLSFISHKFNAFASIWESYLALKEKCEEYLKKNEKPTDHTHNN